MFEAFGKARESLNEAQARYKKTYDKRARRVQKFKPDDKVYLDIEKGGIRRGKLSHSVVVAFDILRVEKNTKILVIQRET